MTPLNTQRFVQRLVGVLIAVSLSITSGCATSNAVLSNSSDQNLVALDPQRAYLSLREIEPTPEAPVSTDSIKPLSNRAARQVAKARRLSEQSRFTEAISALDRALRYEPKHAAVHVALAQLNLRSGNLERARHHAEKAVAAAPNAIAAHLVIGQYHAAHDEHVEAIVAYRTGLLCGDAAKNPRLSLMAHYYLAQSLFEEGYLSASLDESKLFLADPDHAAGDPTAEDKELLAKRTPAREMRSDILERLGRYSEAAQEVHAIVLAHPENANRTLRCARLWLGSKKYDLAIQVANALTPSDPQGAFEALLEIHTKARRLDEFIQTLRAELHQSPDDAQRTLNLADALVLANLPEEARESLSAFLERHAATDLVRQRLIEMLLQAQQWHDALAQCSRGVLANPEGAEVYEQVGLELGENPHASAMLLADDAMRAEVGFAEHYLLGLVATGAKQVDRAIGFFEQSRRQSQTFVPNRVALGEALIRAYRYSEALGVVQRKEEGTAESYRLERLLGVIYDRLDDREKAEQHLRAALQINRDDRKAHLALAHLLISAQENNRAKLHLRTLIGRDPQFDEARELLASVYSNELKLEAAIEQLEELRRLTDKPLVRARCDALLTLRRNGDLDAYRQALSEAMKEHGEDATTWIALGDSYSEAQDEESAAAFRKALVIDGQNEDAFRRLSGAYGRLLQFEEAADLQKRFLARRPNRQAWRFQLLQLWQLTLQTDRAMALARKEMSNANLSDQTRNRYRNTLLTILRRTGREQETLGLLKQWHEDRPNDIATAAELSAYYLRKNQPDEAVLLLDKLHEQNPDNRQIHESLIDALVVADRHERAAQHALDLLERDPESRQAIGLMATLLAENDQTTDALELIENQLLHSDQREFYQNLGNRILVAGEQFDQAIEQTQRLLDGVDRTVKNITQRGAGRREGESSAMDAIWFPDRPFSLNRLEERLNELRVQLLSIQIAARRYAEAREHILPWLESSRNQRFSFVLLLQLRACQTMLGETDAATETTERALMIENDNVGLNNDVAYGWIDQGIRLDEAEARIRFAVARNPDQGAYLDTYGWLMYKKGNFAEAKKWLLRARAFQRLGDAVIFDHLGDACWRLGQAPQATEHWTAALEKVKDTEDDQLSPDEKRVREIAPSKIEAAQAGQEPSVAALAQPVQQK